MTCEYLPVARRELIKAAAYYFGISGQLGRDFVTEIHRTIDRVVESPEMGSHTAKGTRRRAAACRHVLSHSLTSLLYWLMPDTVSNAGVVLVVP
jgi:hypothetical protein